MPDSIKTFNTFIFDLDGTLLDTVPDLTLLANRVLKEIGYPQHTQEEILSYVGAGVRRLIYLALPENVDDSVRDEAMDVWNAHFHEYYHHTKPFEDIVDLVDNLIERKCKIGIMSNKLQAGVDVIIEKQLPNRFKVLLGESEQVPRKPNPTGILMALDLLKANKKDSLYLGDSPSDIVAAHNAGIKAAAVLWGYHKKEDFDTKGPGKPDIFLTSPGQLLSYVAD